MYCLGGNTSRGIRRRMRWQETSSRRIQSGGALAVFGREIFGDEDRQVEEEVEDACGMKG